MMKLWMRIPAAACLATIGMGLLAVTPVGAVPARSSAAPAAGIYNATVDFIHGPILHPTLRLNTGGTFTISGGGPTGTWTESGTSVTMKGHADTKSYVLTIQQIGTNLGSKTRPGSVKSNGVKQASWYAIRKP